MEIELYKGHTTLRFNVPENSSFLVPRIIQPSVDRISFTGKLAELIKKHVPPGNAKAKVALVVADKTRLSELQKYMPWIEQGIREGNLPGFTLDIFIAYGSHPAQSDEESEAAYGDYFQTYPFIHHDARNGSFQDFGTTTRGTRILINEKLFNEHDAVITYGSISHHYFAGFGGGRKLIFPGLARLSSILHNHSLFLDFQNRILQEHCQSGVLDGNPIAEDLKEIYDQLPPTIGIHAILNPRGEVCAFKAGDDYKTFEQACRTYSEYYKIDTEEQFDLVLASTGGYPKDINFIQAHKSIHSAARFVRDGGTLILIAECPDGLGNRQLPEIFELGDWNKIFPSDRSKYENNTGTVLAQLKKSLRLQIKMITSLDKEICARLGVDKTDARAAQEIIDQAAGSIAIIRNASLVF